MKIKFKGVLLAMLIGTGMTFSSCTKDGPEGSGSGSGKGNGPTEYGYFSFKLSTDPNTIPTRNDDTLTEAGEDAESFVNDGFIALYDASTMELKYRFELDITNYDSDNDLIDFEGTSVSEYVSSTNMVFVKSAEKIVKQEYKMLAVLNPNEDMWDATNLDAGRKYYNDFDAAQTDQTIDDYGINVDDLTRNAKPSTTYTRITMTNSRGLVTVTEEMFYEDEESAETATNIPVVAVDRIFAKVIFTVDNNLTMPEGAELGNIMWALDITNKSTFWVRHLANTAPKSDNLGVMETNTTFRKYLYAVDPNWDGISLLRKEANGEDISQIDKEAYYAQHYNYLSAGDLNSGYFSNEPGSGDMEYALENTMAAKEQWEDVTTRVLISANYVPKDFYGGESYYCFAGMAFSHEDIYKMVNDEMPWPYGLKEAVEEAVDAGIYDFSDQWSEPVASKSHQVNGVPFNYYKDGVSYYAVKVRHFDDNLSPGAMQYGRYGVVRNNVYKVNLTKLSGPGSPVIPDPEGPDDLEEEWISAKIMVNEWVVRNQNVEN